jgi:hypothetical protein
MSGESARKQAEREVGRTEDRNNKVNKQRAKTGQHQQEQQAENHSRQDEGGMGTSTASGKGNNRTGDREKRSKR